MTDDDYFNRLFYGDGRKIGYVTNYFPDKGYGFCKCDQESYFFHINNLLSKEPLSRGDKVEFSVGFNKRKQKEEAVDVIAMGNSDNYR